MRIFIFAFLTLCSPAYSDPNLPSVKFERRAHRFSLHERLILSFYIPPGFHINELAEEEDSLEDFQPIRSHSRRERRRTTHGNEFYESEELDVISLLPSDLESSKKKSAIERRRARKEAKREARKMEKQRKQREKQEKRKERRERREKKKKKKAADDKGGDGVLLLRTATHTITCVRCGKWFPETV